MERRTGGWGKGVDQEKKQQEGWKDEGGAEERRTNEKERKEGQMIRKEGQMIRKEGRRRGSLEHLSCR